jgi:CelD/BcsL family acetyltransferase involved in cellulose biosynthesis
MQDLAVVSDRAEEPPRSAGDPDPDAAGRSATGLRVEFEPVAALGPATARAWEDLAARASEPNPFFSPAFAVAAARHLASGEHVSLAGVYDGDELIFAAPILDSRRWRRLRIRTVRTWCHTQCFFGAPLVVDDERAEAAWRLVFEALAARRPRPRFLILELMPIGGRFESALQRGARGRAVARYETYARASLDRSSLGGDVAPQRGRRRRELERRSRQVERVTGAAFTTHDAAGEPGAAEGFVALEDASWTGRAGTALGSDPFTAAFALQAARGLHDRGQLVLLTTTAGTGVAAQLFAIRDRDTLFMFKIAFAEPLARFSPGTQLVHDMVQWFAGQPTLEHIDSCAHHENEFINRLLPDRRSLATVLVALDGGMGAVATKLMPRLVALHRRIRRNAQ